MRAKTFVTLKAGDRTGQYDPRYYVLYVPAHLGGCTECDTLQPWNNGIGWLHFRDEHERPHTACPDCTARRRQPGLF